jgi:hypothetical protein
MKVDLVFRNENTTEGNVSVLRCQTKEIAKKAFIKLDAETKIEYAYCRKFSGWHYNIKEWYKRKDGHEA